MTFYSEIDWWLAAILLVAMGIALGSIPEVLQTKTQVVGIALTSLLVATALLLASAFLMRYEITSGSLSVKAWPLYHKKIPIAEIHTIERTNTPISSPALSLDRIRILYKSGSVIISPRDQGKFIAMLQAENRAIDVR